MYAIMYILAPGVSSFDEWTEEASLIEVDWRIDAPGNYRQSLTAVAPASAVIAAGFEQSDVTFESSLYATPLAPLPT